MKKPEKIDFVKELAKKLSSCSSTIVINYSGMNVGVQQDLKLKLADVGAKMIVVKNTLFNLAAKQNKYPKEITDKVLEGQNALVLSEDDPIAPLQVLANFAKEFEIPSLRVGIVEGDFQDEEALTKLSTLPGKEVLYAQVVGSMMSSSYELIGTLRGNLQKLIYVLQNAGGGEFL